MQTGFADWQKFLEGKVIWKETGKTMEKSRKYPGKKKRIPGKKFALPEKIWKNQLPKGTSLPHKK